MELTSSVYIKTSSPKLCQKLGLAQRSCPQLRQIPFCFGPLADSVQTAMLRDVQHREREGQISSDIFVWFQSGDVQWLIGKGAALLSPWQISPPSTLGHIIFSRHLWWTAETPAKLMHRLWAGLNSGMSYVYRWNKVKRYYVSILTLPI